MIVVRDDDDGDDDSDGDAILWNNNSAPFLWQRFPPSMQVTEAFGVSLLLNLCCLYMRARFY